MRTMRRLFIAVLVLSMVAVGAQPAGAATAAQVVATGTGRFSPGLWITSPPQSVSIDATAQAVLATGMGADTGVVSCSFSGTEVNSQATFSGGCFGSGVLGPLGLWCSFDSQRVVLAFVWRGHCTVSTVWGSATTPMAAEWTIVPTSANPIQSFATTGELHQVPVAT